MSDLNKSETHRYWANSVGFVAFCALLCFAMHTCLNINTIDMEKEKTKQLEIIHKKNK